MGPPPDSDQMLNMLENPQFQSTINEALQNPAMIDMMIQQNPMLRDMGPGVRQMMQSPEFRRMLTDPSSIRNMMQMQRAMGMGDGGMGGQSAFPAPGVTNTTPDVNDPNSQPQNAPPNPFGAMPQNPMANPFAGLFGGNPFGNAPQPPVNPSAGNTQPDGTQSSDNPTERSGTTDQTQGETPAAAQNPFASLLNPAMLGNGGQAGANPWFNPQQNPFLRDPAMMSQMMQAMGGQGAGGAGGAGANPLAGLFGGGGFGAPQPPDNRPPEERYAEQLRQLNDMGFYEFERNIEALRRTGGSVQGAVEYLLGNPS